MEYNKNICIHQKISDCPVCGYFTDDWYNLYFNKVGDYNTVECDTCHSDLEITLISIEGRTSPENPEVLLCFEYYHTIVLDVGSGYEWDGNNI